MGKIGCMLVFVCILVSTTFTTSLAVNLRKLIDNQPANSSVSGNSTHQLNKNLTDSGKPGETKPEKLPKTAQKDTARLPTDSKNTAQNSTSGNSSSGKDGVDDVNAKGKKQTSGDDENCEGHLTICTTKDFIACAKPSRNGSLLFLVVQNNGESSLNVSVSLPNDANNPLQTLDVPKGPKRRAKSKDFPSFVNRSTKLVLKSGKEECVLGLSHPISVDRLIRQLSFYSKQMTPIYAVYGSFLLVLLFGGTWACCKLRKRNREKGIPYQELEMGVPESTSAANIDVTEGWDHDWDNDDWDEDVAVKSPAGLQVRNVSADGLTSRSPPRKDGWEIDWED